MFTQIKNFVQNFFIAKKIKNLNVKFHLDKEALEQAEQKLKPKYPINSKTYKNYYGKDYFEKIKK